MYYLMLDPNYQIRYENKFGIIFDRRIEYILKNYIFISLSDYHFLKLFDGRYTENDLINILKKYKNIDYSFSKDIVKKFIDKYHRYILFLENKQMREDIEIKIKNNYRINTNYKYKEKLITPLSISLVLTENCFANCKYCYANGTTGKKDSITTKEVFKILKESYDMGVGCINLSGGDPFTRNDIYEIIKKIEELKLNYSISTKKIFNDEEIKKLILSNIKELQISIDSYDDEICKNLIGIDNYYSRQKIVISKLINNGIKVKINIVITKINIKTIPTLVKELLELGVNKIFLSPYIKSLGRHDDIFFCNIEDHKLLKCDLPVDDRIDYKIPNYDKVKYTNIDEMQFCTGGKMGLVVYSNGNVGICERLPDNILNIGNIKYNTLFDLWHCEKLKSVIEPNRDLFDGEECYNCEMFEQCIIKKGICYVRSYLHNKRKIYSQDPYCPKSNIYEKMF